MKKMNFETLKMQRWYNMYQFALKHGYYSLELVYKNPSARKQEEWQHICKIFTDLNGHGLAVISYNSFFFAAAFIFRENGKKYFVVETHTEQYISEMKED